MLDLPKPDPNTSVAQQVELWSIRAIVLAQKGQNDAAIKAFQTAIALCPKDYPNVSLQLATLYVQLERFDDAETIYRQVYASFSDSIPFIEQFEDILGKLKKPDEAEKMTKRFYELVRIYKRP